MVEEKEKKSNGRQAWGGIFLFWFDKMRENIDYKTAAC